MRYIMCILCTIQASRLGDRVVPHCNFILDDRAHVFNGVIARSKVDDHDAWCDVCARDVNILAARWIMGTFIMFELGKIFIRREIQNR